MLPYPEMTVANLKILVPGFDDIQGSPDGGGGSASQPQLSHMELLPVPPQMSSSELMRLTVMVIFSHLPEVEASHYQESYSIIARWELQSARFSLHTVFDQLNPASKTAGSVELVCALLIPSRDRALISHSMTTTSKDWMTSS